VNACSTVRWNEGVSFPIRSGHGCIGCSEDGSWDQGAFHDRITNVAQFGVEANADEIGVAAAGAVGGVPCAIDGQSSGAVGGFSEHWLDGGGPSSQSVLAYGNIPERANDISAENLPLPRGAIVSGDPSTVHDVDVMAPEQVQEFVDHSWYEYGEPGVGLHPWDGETGARFALGPDLLNTRTNIEEIGEGAKYSWIEAPRWRGHAMEVGPPWRDVIGYAQGHEDISEQASGLLRKMDLPVEALFSTLGRTAARALESEYCRRLQSHAFDELFADNKNGDETAANIEK
jgi:hydrogenase large subunit